MRVKSNFVSLQQQSKWYMSWQIQLILALPQLPLLLSFLRWWLCCCALIIVAPIVCGDFVLFHCFGLQYFVSFIVLKSTCWRREYV